MQERPNSSQKLKTPAEKKASRGRRNNPVIHYLSIDEVFPVYPSKASLFIHQGPSVYPSKAFLFIHQSTSCLSFTALPVHPHQSIISLSFCLSFNVLPVCLSKAFQFILHSPSCLYIKVLPVYPSKYSPSIHQSPSVYPSKPFLLIHPSTPSLFIEILLVYPSKYFQSIHQINPSLSIEVFQSISYMIQYFLSIHRSPSVYQSHSVCPSKYSLSIHQSTHSLSVKVLLFILQDPSCLPINIFLSTH